jgi:amino acid transporter
MGWIVCLVCVALIVFIARKSLDRETTRNFKLLGKILGFVVIIIVLWFFLLFNSR